MAEQFSIGELLAELSIDDRQFIAGVKRVDGQMKVMERGVRRASESARLNVNKLGNAFQSLAVSATNANPQIARLADVVGTFALGSAQMAAVLGGMAALALAWKAASDGAKVYAENVDDVLAKGRQLIQQQQFGAKLPLLQLKANTLAAREFATGEQADGSSKFRDVIGALLGASGFAGLFPKFRTGAQLTKKWADDIETANEVLAAIDDALSAIDLETAAKGFDKLRAKVERLNSAIAADVGARGGVGIPLSALQGNIADAKNAQRIANIEERARRKKFGIGATLTPMVPDRRGQGGGLTDNAVGGLRKNFDSFLGGLKGVAAGFSPAAIGAGLANTVASKALSGLGGLMDSLFGGVSTAITALAAALAHNTRALQASSRFLAGLLESTGLADEASTIAKVLENVIGRAVTSKDGRINLTQFRQDLAKAGISNETFNQVAAALGIDISTLSLEILQQFGQQLSSATSGLGDFGDEITRATEVLRNAPAGFKIRQGIFSATVGRDVGGVNFYGDIFVDAQSKSIREIMEELARESARSRTGGGSGLDRFRHRRNG